MKSIWQSNVKMPRFDKLDSDIKTDVAVIGGGISGLLTAYKLKERGIDCVVLEKGRICESTTGHTTGKITAGHGLVYDDIIKRYGKSTAEGYYLSNMEALGEFRILAEKHPCDFEIRDNYVYSLKDRAKIEREIRALDSIGADVEFCKQTKLPFEIAGAVKMPDQAQFNPLLFLSRIASELKIYENTFAKEVTGDKIITDNGTVTAKNIVIATHFPFINSHGLYFAKLYQSRSYVLALRDAIDVSGMYVDEQKEGLSFRNYGEYLILCGGGHRTGKKGRAYAELREIKEKYFPSAVEKYAFAAEDCMSLDGMPYVGAYSRGLRRVYVTSGFNKWGMSGSMVGATLICDAITEEKNKYAEIFTPQRKILHPQLFANIFESTVGLLTPRTKRCSHLGCALKWNKAEHTWDCPCHGSRFSKEGRVINNPAQKNIDM